MMSTRVSSVLPLLLLILLSVPLPVAAQRVTFPDRPPEGVFLVDETATIGALEAEEVNRISAALLDEAGIPIVVVVLRDLASRGAAGHTIERYARELFDHWGIGSAERNDGMLLLISIGDREARIELGLGWGNRFDADAQQVMNTLIVPRFREGRHSEGVLAGVRGMDAMARGLALPTPATPAWVFFAAFGVFAIVTGSIFSLVYSGRSGWAWILLLALGAFLLFLLRNVNAHPNPRRGSDGGSGGGAFGGGRSGGGGATGRW